MSYRYNTTDIIVGVGMCAIVFGALLFFLVANGTIQASLPKVVVMEPANDIEAGMTWLQPALGQAIVEQTLNEQRGDQMMAEAAAEWNRRHWLTTSYNLLQVVSSQLSWARPRQAQPNTKLVFRASWGGPS